MYEVIFFPPHHETLIFRVIFLRFSFIIKFPNTLKRPKPLYDSTEKIKLYFPLFFFFFCKEIFYFLIIWFSNQTNGFILNISLYRPARRSLSTRSVPVLLKYFKKSQLEEKIALTFSAKKTIQTPIISFAKHLWKGPRQPLVVGMSKFLWKRSTCRNKKSKTTVAQKKSQFCCDIKMVNGFW